MNNDKYKSVRNLEAELVQNRTRLLRAEEEAKMTSDLRKMLA